MFHYKQTILGYLPFMELPIYGTHSGAQGGVAVENAQLNQQKEVKAHDNYHNDMETLFGNSQFSM